MRTTPRLICPPHQQTPSSEPLPEFRRFEFDYELDAYYSNVSFTIALTREPILRLGENPEEDIYEELLRRALVPRFLFLEASINPLPYLGVYIKKNHRGFYDNAELSGSFNWIKALTAGFEEPWAASVLLGNVVDFDRRPGPA